jgi:hypothetical protein
VAILASLHCDAAAKPEPEPEPEPEPGTEPEPELGVDSRAPQTWRVQRVSLVAYGSSGQGSAGVTRTAYPGARAEATPAPPQPHPKA